MIKSEAEMKELIEEKWEEILSLLENEYDISIIMINTWIRSLKIYEVKDNTVYFYVDEKLGENAVKFLHRKEFDSFLLSSIRETLNNINIEIVIDEKKNYIQEDEQEKNDELNESFQELLLKNNLDPKYTFDNFIVADNNRLAHAACLAVADMPGQDNFNPLFLYGNSGLGKTHLMQSIANFILKKNNNANVMYVPANQFTHEIVEAIHYQKTNEFRNKYRKNVDVLLIDDIQYIIGKESTQNELFNTFNELYNAKKQIILSSDRPAKEFKTLDERMKSRFSSGLPLDLHEPDYETRMAILKNKAEMDHLTGIPEEVFVYIAENITDNIRDLEGALNKVSSFSNLIHYEITLDLAKDALKDFINNENDVTITPDFIINIVSEHMDISPNDIKSKKRNQDIATARQIVMYLCRQYTAVSLQSIGNAVGGKDHTTVINGIKRIEDKIKKDPSFKNTMDTIIKKLNPST